MDYFMKIPYRFSEDKIVKSLQDYLDGTYSGHYTNEEKKEIQVIDVWESMGIAEEMCLGTIVKYAMRYGKKDGKNKKDLLKIIHYAILALHYGGHGETYTEQDK